MQTKVRPNKTLQQTAAAILILEGPLSLSAAAAAERVVRRRRASAVASSTGIEIVVRDCTPERVAAWLDSIAGPLGDPTDAGGASVYRTHLGSVVVQPEMEGPGGIGIWFQSAELPWASSAACARQAAREMRCLVWCEPGADYPEVHPLSPAFLEVSTQGEHLFEPPEAELGAAPDPAGM